MEKSYTLDENIAIDKGEFIFTFAIEDISKNKDKDIDLTFKLLDANDESDPGITLTICNTSSQLSSAGFNISGKTAYKFIESVSSDSTKYVDDYTEFFKGREYIKVVKKDDDQYCVYRKVTDADNKVSTDNDYFVDNKGDTYESSKLYEVKKLAEKTYKITRNFDVKPLFYYWGINGQNDYSDDIEYDGNNFLNLSNISHIRLVINKNAKSMSIWQKLKESNSFTKVKNFIFEKSYERKCKI